MEPDRHRNLGGAWAARLPATGAARLASLRDANLQVCQCGEWLWVRGPAWDGSLDLPLRSLLDCQPYWVRPDRQVVPHGRRAARGYLPDGPWSDLKEWLLPELPIANLPAGACAQVDLRLVRSDDEQAANVFATNLDNWAAYALTAPQARLKPLTFAVNNARQVILRGTPMPPLRLQCYVERSGVATPAGWNWQPRLDARVIRQVLALDHGDMAIFDCDGRYQRIPADSFVAANRSAVRLTLGAPDCA